FVVAHGHQIRFKGARDIDKLRLLSALIRPGRAELPAHDNPNHVVICSVGDQRGQELASHFSRRIPVPLRTLSEIGDMTMLGLSEDLPDAWTTFEPQPVSRRAATPPPPAPRNHRRRPPPATPAPRAAAVTRS